MRIGFVVGVAGIFAVGVYGVNAKQHSMTINGCASLLPQGHSYEFSIKGSFKDSGSGYEYSGTMAMTDGTKGDNREMGEAIGPFLQCVSKLIK